MTDLKTHRAAKRQKEKVHAQARTLKEAVNVIDRLETEIEAVRTLKGRHTSLQILPKKKSGVSEATAVSILSDVHIGNHFSLGQTNGVNEYSVAIARERCITYFERVVRLTQKERQDVHIEELVLILGGDFIDGNLHTDTALSNIPAAPMTQAVIAQDIIEAGLKYLEAKGDFSRLTIVCKDGNHGRVTPKQHWHSRTGNSLEWYMYYNLAARHPQFNWVIEESIHSYLRIYDYMLRIHHGDTISFGGQNGFYQNLHIKINGNNSVINAHLDVFGHLHQYTPLRRYVVNGSVKGFDPYSMSLQAFNKGEPPIQAYFLIDKKRFTTVQIPIIL